jgi:hypothetical protein
MKQIFASALLAAVALQPVHCRAAGAAAYALPGTEVVPLQSAINGVRYELRVKLPAGYARGTKRYPLLVTLDADYQFAIVANQAARLASHDQAPELLVVSIGYSGDPEDLGAYRLNRTRDYTPTHVDDGGYGREFQKLSGGGPAFARVIAEEILPVVQERYRVDAGDRLFVGHSFGGLFGAFLLTRHPELFNRYILVSPSLWYDDKTMLAADSHAAARLARKTNVYMGVGSWENQAPPNHAMVDDLNAFAKLLEARHDANLTVETRVYEDETHASVFPAVLSTGIRHLFQ